MTRAEGAPAPFLDQENRAIYATLRRRRPRRQARRLIPERSIPRRALGPTIVLGAVLGILARLLVVSTSGPATMAPLDEAEAESVQSVGLPLAEAAAAGQPLGPVVEPRVLAEQRLRAAVMAPFQGLPGRAGIAVKDLGSGTTVLVNERASFPAASLYKLPVMYEVFKLREAGVLSFRDELTVGPGAAAYDLGTLQWPIGSRITLGTALEQMVTISDNSSAVMLAWEAGAGRINDDLARLGLQQTRVRGDDLSTSAGDMLRLLELIASGQAVDPETSGEMVHLLGRQQVRNRIPSLLPPEAMVANKTGDWEGATHDVGIVYGPRATLVIALLSEGGGDIELVYTAMARAARNVYDLVQDPSFETRPDPPLPTGSYASYSAPARPPLVATGPRVASAPQRPAAALIPAAVEENGVEPTPTPTELPSQQGAAREATRAARSTPKPSATPTLTGQATKVATPTATAVQNAGARSGATAQPTPTKQR